MSLPGLSASSSMVAVPEAPGEFDVTTSHVSAAATLMSVRSLAVSLAVLVSPPPDTVAMLVCGEVAAAPTFTVSVSAGYEALAARTSLRVQGPLGAVQLQPVPLIPLAVRPAG